MALTVTTFQLPTMVSGNSVTSGLNVPGVFVYCYLEVPVMASQYSIASTPLWVKVSSDGTTYRRYTSPELTTNTLVAGINDFQIASSVSQRFVYLPNFAFNYIQVEASAVATAAIANPFKLVCVSNQ